MRAISFLFITLFLSVALSCHATAYAQSPPAATLISPTGSIETSVPAFSWNGAADATWYYLWVNDSTGNVLKQWYRSLDICGSGAECSVAPGVALQAGAGRWWVQAWNPDGYGPWSTSLSFVAGGGAIPEAATLIAPQNNINNSTPEFTWNAVSNASWYYLWVNDSVGSPIKKWYQSTELGCSSGDGICTAIPLTQLASGSGRWWVRSWNASGYGAWSNNLAFELNVDAGNSIPPPVYQDAAGISELDSGWYGSIGEHPVEKISINSPAYPSPIPNEYKNNGWPAHYPDSDYYYSHDDTVQLTIDLFRPADVNGVLPTVFFLSGWRHYHSEQYYSLLYFIASQGFNVVFIPYKETDLTAAGTNALIQNIVSDPHYANKIDTTKIGFMGHSLGGNILYDLANELSDWGGQGRFIFTMATGNGNGPTIDLPANTQVIVQTYNERINDRPDNWGTDPRRSIDALHATRSVADIDKTFLYLPGDESHQSSHSTIGSRYINGKFYFDALEQVGVYRPLESLIRYAFENDTQWKHIGLPDDMPVMQTIDDPGTPGIDNDYQFNRTLNGINFYSADRPYVDLDISNDPSGEYMWPFTGITLSTNKARYAPNENIIALLEKMPAIEEGGLGIYPAADAHSGANALGWIDANAVQNGENNMDGLPAGAYEVRAFTENNDNYNATVRARVAFTVE